MSRTRRLLAVGVPAVLLLTVVAATVQSGRATGSGACAGGAEDVLLTWAEQVPDVVGTHVTVARPVVEAAGVAWDPAAVRLVVDEAAGGTVLEQSGGACGEPLRVLLSSGGPFVAPEDLPPAARSLLGPEPGPLRRLPDADGYLVQSRTALVGDCRSTEAFEGDLAGLEVSCFPAPQDALATAVQQAAAATGATVRVRSSGTREGTWTVTATVDGSRVAVTAVQDPGGSPGYPDGTAGAPSVVAEPACPPAGDGVVCRLAASSDLLVRAVVVAPEEAEEGPTATPPSTAGALARAGLLALGPVTEP